MIGFGNSYCKSFDIGSHGMKLGTIVQILSYFDYCIEIGSEGLVFGAIVEQKVKSVSWHTALQTGFSASVLNEGKIVQIVDYNQKVKKYRGKKQNIDRFLKMKEPKIFFERYFLTGPPSMESGSWWGEKRRRRKSEVKHNEDLGEQCYILRIKIVSLSFWMQWYFLKILQ